jgi:ribosomal protein L44E
MTHRVHKTRFSDSRITLCQRYVARPANNWRGDVHAENTATDWSRVTCLKCKAAELRAMSRAKRLHATDDRASRDVAMPMAGRTGI